MRLWRRDSIWASQSKPTKGDRQSLVTPYPYGLCTRIGFTAAGLYMVESHTSIQLCRKDVPKYCNRHRQILTTDQARSHACESHWAAAVGKNRASEKKSKYSPRKKGQVFTCACHFQPPILPAGPATWLLLLCFCRLFLPEYVWGRWAKHWVVADGVD